MQQLALTLAVKNHYDRHRFCVSDCNRSAFEWLDRWPEENQHMQFSSLSGPHGSGKTHLGHIWCDRNNGVYMTAQHAIHRDPSTLAAQARHFVIDLDITSRFNQFIDEEWLFHFYNAIRENSNKYLLLISEQRPNLWLTELKDLKSRLATFITFELRTPDEETLAALLQKQFHDCGLSVNEDVITYLTRRMERSFEHAKILVNTINNASAKEGRAVTIPFVKSILE